MGKDFAKAQVRFACRLHTSGNRLENRMLLSPLARQLVTSLLREPHRWDRHKRSILRDDGVEIQFINPYARSFGRPRMVSPRDVQFGGVESYFLLRALRKWQHRPL